MSFRRQYLSPSIATRSGIGVAFGFDATYIRIYQDNPGPTYLRFDSTGLGTTDGFPMSSGDSPFTLDQGFPIKGMSLGTTTTSGTLRILALSG